MLERATNARGIILTALTAVTMMGMMYIGCSEEGGLEHGVVSTLDNQTADNSKKPRISGPLSSIPMEITSAELSSEHKTAVFQLDVPTDEGRQSVNSDGITRILEIQIFDDTDSFVGYTATLTDAGGRMLWEFESHIDTLDSQHSWIAERTASDELIIEGWIGENSLTEIYTQNGVARTFTVPTADLEYIRAIHGNLLSGVLSREGNDPIVQSLNEFDNFYDFTSTLNDNPEGQLVAQFLTSGTVGDWLEVQYPDTSDAEVSRIPDWVCEAAAGCAAVKCPAGGLVNPVCDVCLGVMVICIIDRIFS